MRAITDKLGYILIILGFIALIYKHGTYLLFETVFLISGKSIHSQVISKKSQEEKYTYYFKVKEAPDLNYSSLPSKKIYYINDIVKVRTIPFFEKVVLGEFNLTAYLIGIGFFLFGLLICILSIWMIFDVNNKYTIRIKERYV